MKKILFSLLLAVLGMGAQAQTLQDALKAIDSEKYDQAKTMLLKLKASNPTDGQYTFYLGNVYLLLGEDKLAKETFDQGVTLKKNAHLNFIGQGNILLNDGKPEEAAAAFNQAMAKVGKKDITERLYIARAYMQTFNPNYEKAAEFARQVVAIDPNSAQGQLTLGDAEFNLGNMNEAYAAYRSAFNLDNNLLRAKLHLALITKNAQAFPEAIQALNEIMELNPAYAPAYRERAEVYYLWATLDGSVYDEYIPKALKDYEEYMRLTDYSLDARMRHADFLVLAKDYAALEKEAAEMQKIDNVNPRILRYLGFSAFENGNYTQAAQALETFISTVDPRRVLGIDYAYLARAHARIMLGQDMPPFDTVSLRKVTSNLKMAIEKEADIDTEFRDLGKKLYTAKGYGYAAEIFGILAGVPKASLTDQFYFANSIFYNVATIANQFSGAGQEQQLNNAITALIPKIEVADTVYTALIRESPGTLDTYFNRARLNRYVPGSEAKVAEMFQQYIDAAMAKGDSELSKSAVRKNMSEAFSNIGAFYLDTDVVKAKENFQKALEFDPTNQQAVFGMEFLNQKKK